MKPKIFTVLCIILFFTLPTLVTTSAQTVTVGVISGNIFEYIYSFSWESTDPNATMPSEYKELIDTQSIKITIINVSESLINLNLNKNLKNGTSSTYSGTINVDKREINIIYGLLIIRSNAKPNELIYPSGGAARLDEITTRTYAVGQLETIRWLKNATSDITYLKVEIYYDTVTGVAAEYQYEEREISDSYTTTTKESMILQNSNIWNIKTALSCSVSKGTITQGESIVVSGSLNVTLSGKTVTLTYRKPDGSIVNRTVTTGSDGSYSDSYTPDATGSWSVTASWEGDSTYNGATSSSRSFMVNAVPFIETPLGMAMIGGGIVLIVVVVVVSVLRKRKT